MTYHPLDPFRAPFQMVTSCVLSWSRFGTPSQTPIWDPRGQYVLPEGLKDKKAGRQAFNRTRHHFQTSPSRNGGTANQL